ncbi:Fic family protein [Nocardia grenadensis]|uniref:Fic family protein n=1 Tax=Nocardia grenadensis TaxID=931537 RepID=UPI0007A4DE73|nr:Fic family protein [Nocardia grenadensis]
MQTSTVLADLLRKQVLPEVGRPVADAADYTATEIRRVGGTLNNEVAPRTLGADAEGARLVGHASTDDPAAAGLDDVTAVIEQRSAELGLRSAAERALESSLLIDEPLHRMALIRDQPHPELLFGDGEWAGYLDARAFARRHGSGELSISFLTELHQRLARFSPDGAGGVFADRERWGTQSRRLTDEEIAQLEANPHLEYLPPGTGGFLLDGGLRYLISTPDAARAKLESLCDWYRNVRGGAGFDPYALAAELQQRAVSIHPWQDYNGRFSRLLMNWSLECDGLSPAALHDFDKDVFSTTSDWADAVRTGSQDFAVRAHRLETGAGEMEPVELFDLDGDYEHYRALGRSTAPFDCGDHQDIEGCRRQLDQLRATPRDS